MTMMNNNPYKLCVAPMMGHTDMHFRYLLRLISKHTMLYTEMVASNAILHNKSKKLNKLEHIDDGPVGFQLGGDNPDQLAECAKIVESLGLQIVRSLMTLIAFIPILYGLSDKVDIPYLRDIDGSLVWVALIVSIGGLFISWFVGWYLPGLEYNNQKVEAAFRKDLVLAEDDKSYAQPEKLWELFIGIRFNYHRLFKHYSYFNAWMNTYDQFMVIVPYLIVGPGLFTGLIMLGTVTQVSNAFQRVHGGFALFLHNWTTITELRSIWRRLTEFEKNLTLYENKNIK